MFLASLGCTAGTAEQPVPDADPIAMFGIDSGPPIGTRLDAGSRDAGGDAGPPPAPWVLVESGAPDDAASRFSSAARSARAPELIYPADGVLVPPNLTGLELHFLPASHDLFEIEFGQRGSPSVVVYTPCTALASGCRYEPSSAVREALAERRAHGSYRVVIRGVGGDEARVGESSARGVTLADDEIIGGVYFWTIWPVEEEPPAILRYDFDRGAREPEVYIRPSDVGATCVGCHALSRDGSQIALGLDAPGGIYATAQTASRELGPRREGGLFSFSPLGDRLVVGGTAALRDVALSITDVRTGAVLETFDAQGTAPDWSPAGDEITFATSLGAIGFFVNDAGHWRRGEDLPGVWSAHYPTYSPDARWLLFLAEGSLAAVSLEDRIVRPLPSTTIPGADTWPKWNPGVYYQGSSPLFWFCFSSRRDYGLLENVDGRSQIWMAAFDPRIDGELAFPPFRMPAQDWEANNFIPQWALRVERQPCEEDGDCPGGEFCADGYCGSSEFLE